MTADQISSVARRPAGAARKTGRVRTADRPRTSMTARRHRAFYLFT